MLKRFIRKLLGRRNNLIEQVGRLPVEAHFRDGYGNEHKVLQGLKDLLKPGWEKNLNRQFTFQIPSRKESQIRLRSSGKKLRDMKDQLEKHGVSLCSRKVLEVGCYGGTVSILMQRDYNTRNTAIDLPQYYIAQRNEEPDSQHLKEQSNYLSNLRNIFLETAGLESNAVNFIDDDITCSNLDPSSYDFIFSFETLEHVTDPCAMFKELYRLLKPGGYMYHHYNPFFSLKGGHSLGTTDILWGHALLEKSDLRRYFNQFRPDEESIALRFLENNLNRMTISNLYDYTSDKFEIMHMREFSDNDYSPITDSRMIDILQNIHHQADMRDMVTDGILIIMKKIA